MKTMKALLLAALIVLTSSSAWAGWVITYDGGGVMSMEKVYIQDNKMRQDLAGLSVLVDVDKGWLYYINTKNKTYWAGPPSAMKKQGEAEANKMMEDMLKGMPKAQREAMKKAMAQQQAKQKLKKPRVKVEVKKTSQTKTIAGHKCRLYKIFSNGEQAMDMWIAPSVSLKGEIDARKMSKMMGSMSSDMGGGSNPMEDPQVQALWKKGYPLAQTVHMMGNAEVSRASKVEKKSIPAKIFKVPSGYRKVSIMQVMGMGG